MSTSSSYNDNEKAKAAKASEANRPSPTQGSKATGSAAPPAIPVDRAEADPVSFGRNAVRIEQLDPKRVEARKARAAKYLK